MITSKAPNPTITDSNSPYYTDLVNFNKKWTLKGMIGDADAVISNGGRAIDTAKSIRRGSIVAGDFAYLGNRQGMVTNVKEYLVKMVIENASGAFTVGETITGGTSTETADIVAIGPDFLLLENVSGAFTDAEQITGGTSTETADVTSTVEEGGVLSITVNEDMRYLPQEYKDNSPENFGYDADNSNRNRTVTYVLTPEDALSVGDILGGQHSLYTGIVMVIGKQTDQAETWSKPAQDAADFQTKFE